MNMKISSDNIELACPETEVYHGLLSLDGKHILELGCGSAMITRDIAEKGENRRITALEVDEIAHADNLQITDLPNVDFMLAGAEDIPLDDETVDVAFMFKSLHHVPVDMMDQAMREIRRVLKPGGKLYVSEPVFAGDFNEILRLFHDERVVREAAFATLQRTIEDGLFGLVEEKFFLSPMMFESFEDFENRIIKVTHTHHELADDLYDRVKQEFMAHADEDGARFEMPIRVDLLEKS
jgi:ubiquinone/menaquinone biosynthesis C-methylase UbiE